MIPKTVYKDLGPHKNGSNSALVITINTRAQQWAAVWMQERIESDEKRKLANLFWWHWAGNKKQQQFERELLGHMAEALVSRAFYGQALDAALRREALAMQQGYDGLFKDLSVNRLIELMKRRQQTAAAKVRAYTNELSEVYEDEQRFKEPKSVEDMM